MGGLDRMGTEWVEESIVLKSLNASILLFWYYGGFACAANVLQNEMRHSECTACYRQREQFERS